jgi:hypothetical protein
MGLCGNATRSTKEIFITVHHCSHCPTSTVPPRFSAQIIRTSLCGAELIYYVEAGGPAGSELGRMNVTADQRG